MKTAFIAKSLLILFGDFLNLIIRYREFTISIVQSSQASLVQREVARRKPCRRDCLSGTADLKIMQNDGKTIPQSLSRQLPLHKGAFFVCANF